MYASRRSTGFTLIELLVVIGIIGLLISILLPTLNAAKQSAQLVVCQSNLRQFGIGYTMYCDRSRGMLPIKGPDGSLPGETFGPLNNLAGVDDTTLWFNAVPAAMGTKSYYDLLLDDQNGSPLASNGGRSIFVCPAAGDIGTRPGGFAEDVLSADGKYFLLYGSDSNNKLVPIPSPTREPYFKFNMSYVMNLSLTDVSNSVAATQSFSTVKLSQLHPSSNVVLMVEKLVNPKEYKDAAVQKFIAENPGVYNGAGSLNLADAGGFKSNIAQPKSNWKRFTTRHFGGGNLLFADGHVGYFKWRDTQIPANQLPYVAAVNPLVGSNANQPGTIVWSIAGPIQ